MKLLAIAAVLLSSAFTAAMASPTSIGNLSDKCAGGGTRTATGTYDASTGAVNFSITLTACVDSDGNTHNGTVGVAGTVAPSANSSAVYDFTNLAYTFNTTDSIGTSGGSTQRTCTWTKNGTYNLSSNLFNGTLVKTNCTLTITNEKEAVNILEYAIRKSAVSDGS